MKTIIYKTINVNSRELLSIYDFSDDYKALSQKLYPHISIKEAKESITTLPETLEKFKNGNGILAILNTNNWIQIQLQAKAPVLPLLLQMNLLLSIVVLK